MDMFLYDLYFCGVNIVCDQLDGPLHSKDGGFLYCLSTYSINCKGERVPKVEKHLVCLVDFMDQNVQKRHPRDVSRTYVFQVTLINLLLIAYKLLPPRIYGMDMFLYDLYFCGVNIACDQLDGPLHSESVSEIEKHPRVFGRLSGPERSEETSS
ncbi:24087_t:CDS:2 [Gigaspora rosea]|nr:24087_t:CDS:2 [Gigaspora rosea]